MIEEKEINVKNLQEILKLDSAIQVKIVDISTNTFIIDSLCAVKIIVNFDLKDNEDYHSYGSVKMIYDTNTNKTMDVKVCIGDLELGNGYISREKYIKAVELIRTS